MEAPATFYDIVTPAAPIVPPPPESASLLWIVVAGAVLALAGLVLLRRWWLLRGLRQLARQWRSRCYDDRETVFLLAAELRAKFKLRQITVQPPAVIRASGHARWRIFVQQLDALRYQAGSNCGETILWLMAETRYWLLQTHYVRKAVRKC